MIIISYKITFLIKFTVTLCIHYFMLIMIWMIDYTIIYSGLIPCEYFWSIWFALCISNETINWFIYNIHIYIPKALLINTCSLKCIAFTNDCNCFSKYKLYNKICILFNSIPFRYLFMFPFINDCFPAFEHFDHDFIAILV